MTILYAIVFGLIFGIVLHKIGAANPNNIINMLRLKDFYLIKVILFAIGFSSLILFIVLSLGFYDPHFSVKSAYVGVIAGGLIFGIGWSLSGFCPGTSVVSVGAGRKDALFFIIGGLIGAFIYMISYASLKGTFLFEKLGGKITLVDTGTGKYDSLISGQFALMVAIGVAVILIAIAFALPKRKTT
jgi:uncharacterized membrane protein YedE/YeeE